MSDGASAFGRLAQRTLQACVRGLVTAVAAVVGLPLFVASVLSVLSLSAGIGVLLAPKSLLAVRRLASTQRSWARHWSGVTIATPYRPRPVEITNGLIGRLQRCKWLLTDPATWRDLLWALAGVPVSVVLGLLPVFMVVAACWTLVADGGTLLFGWWNTAPPGFWGQVFFLSLLPLGVVMGPLLLKAQACAVASLLAPTRKAMAAQVGQLAESRSQAVDASAAELRRIERDLHDGAQARLVSLGMNIGFAEQVLRDNPDLALNCSPRRAHRADRPWPSCAPWFADPSAGTGRTWPGRRSAGAHAEPAAAGGPDVDLPGRASAPMESAAYFAIAEALANVVKHSGASRACVQLEYHAGRLVAIVGDNGTGGAARGLAAGSAASSGGWRPSTA